MPNESLEEKMKISKEIREKLVKSNQLIKENKLIEAADCYEAASKLSGTLGHTEIAQEYHKKAGELRQKGGGSVMPSPPAQDPLDKLIAIADKAIAAGKFGEAAKIYEEAARTLPVEAKRLLSEAIELRKKEKELVVTKKEVIRKADTTQSYEDVLEQIKSALEKNQYQDLVTLYGRAAVLAEQLGRRTEAGEYRKAAIEAKKNLSKELRAAPKEGRIQLVQEYTQLLQQIKVFLDEQNWQEAADGYAKAAKLAYDLEEFDRAKLYKEKALKLQEQANTVEHESHIKQKRIDLLNEIKTLNAEKDAETLYQRYQELLEISKQVGITEGLDEINKNLNRLQNIKRRKKLLIEASQAMEKQDYSMALDLFQNSLRISIDLNEPGKVEGFRKIIEELKGKVDKVARDRMVIEQRAQLIADAKAAIKETPPNIKKAVDHYKEAARISIELGEDQVAQSFLQTAKRIDEDQNLIFERENFIRDAEAAVQEKKFLIASNYYLQVAKFSEKLEDRELADKYRKKANALKELAEELEN